MAWDFARDGETGDWIFDDKRDYEGRTGDDLTKQRIAIRMKIPRGSFIYDDTKTLGSRLYATMRYPTERAAREVNEIIREALEGMDDIVIVGISEPEITLGQIHVHIAYQPATPRTSIINTNVETLTTTITIPVPSAEAEILTA